MTPDEFYACRKVMALTGRGLAEMIGCDEATVRRWERGLQTIPPKISRWLTRCAKFHFRNPPPEDWRTKSRANR